MGVNVEISFDGRLAKSDVRGTFDRANKQALAESLQKIQEAAKAAVQFRSKSHKLSASIKTTIHSPTDGEVYLDEDVAPHAPFVHDGTGVFGDSHHSIVIVPENGKALHWKQGGREFFASRVVSDGQPGDPFLYDAAARVEEQVERIFDKAVDKALEEAGI